MAGMCRKQTIWRGIRMAATDKSGQSTYDGLLWFIVMKYSTLHQTVYFESLVKLPIPIVLPHSQSD